MNNTTPGVHRPYRWLVMLGAALLLFSVSSHAIHDNNHFEMDGDSVELTLDDGDGIYQKAVLGDTSAATTFDEAFEADHQLPDLTYYGSGDKDYQPISELQCTTPNNVGPKFNILNGFSGAYRLSTGQVMLVAGADRESNNGSANVGLWLFREKVACDTTTGRFVGHKTDGDILLVSEFTGGGAVSQVIAYRWNDPDGYPNSGDEVLGRLDDPDGSVAAGLGYGGGSGGDDETLIEGAPFITGVDCQDADPHSNGGSNDLCATVNRERVTPAWDGAGLDAGQYFEAAINLNEALGLGEEACFSAFILETRSSFSTNAKLKDFVGGEIQTCGEITIRKVVAGPDHLSKEGSFQFSTSPDLGGDFTLNTTDAVGSDQLDIASVPVGVHTVTESGMPGTFALESIQCDDGSTQSIDSNTAVIDLGVGAHVTCTFTNARLAAPGRILIDKISLGATGTFDFQVDSGLLPGSFSLTTTAAGSASEPQLYDPVPEGIYRFTETVPAGWELVDLTCTDPNNLQTDVTSTDLETATATVVIDDGEQVSCTFTNRRLPHLKLVKTVTNDSGGTAQPDDWTLTASGEGGISNPGGSGDFQIVVPGVTYTLSEAGGPDVYEAGEWSCDGGTQSGDQITLSYGDLVTCTINNNDIGAQLEVIKYLDPQDEPSRFNLLINGTVYARDVGHGGSTGMVEVPTGTSIVSEQAGSGSSLASFDVVIGGDCAADGSITLALRETAVCTITNTFVAGIQGCTPGFWKNSAGSWPLIAGSDPQVFLPGNTLDQVFSIPSLYTQGNPDVRINLSDTLMGALNYGGGEKIQEAAKILLRAAVASLLNGAHFDVAFTQSAAMVIHRVDQVLADAAVLYSGAKHDREQALADILALATELYMDNNLGCPLRNDNATQ